MNIYVVVEGRRSEWHVYRQWIRHLNPGLTYVDNLPAVQHNHFSIISGGGYPHYEDVIHNAIQDVNDHGSIDLLAISVDSEELTYQEKLTEVGSWVSQRVCAAPVSVIVQHFCLETWALGNRRVTAGSAQNQELRAFKAMFDVTAADPELLPGCPERGLNRAQVAYRYLRLCIQERTHGRRHYSKKRPYFLCQPTYLDRIHQRYDTTAHIRSFGAFLRTFQRES